MKPKLSKILFLILSGIYLTLFLSCDNKDDDNYSLLMKKEINYTTATNYLLEKYNTRLLIDSSATFSNELQNNILDTKIVVLDTVVKSIVREGNEYLLNVEICSNDSQKILASFRCSKEVKNVYDKTNHTSLLIAARINRIEKIVEDYISEDEQLNSSVTFQREKFVLYGECKDLIKKPDVYDFDKQKDEG